jgi:PBSX family phage terminase large subunit
MDIDLGIPNKKQDLFLKDHHRHVAFGGARGGGKSWAVRAKAILLATNNPGIKIMIIRRTYPELEQNHIRPLKKLLHVGQYGCPIKYNEAKKTMTFPNESTILFGYCKTDADTDRYQGTEVDVLFLDEATQLTEQQIKDLNSCVRGPNDFPKRTYYTCNPGGRGHGYIKRLFVTREYMANARP